jgi:hypothetical protein
MPERRILTIEKYHAVASPRGKGKMCERGSSNKVRWWLQDKDLMGKKKCIVTPTWHCHVITHEF